MSRSVTINTNVENPAAEISTRFSDVIFPMAAGVGTLSGVTGGTITKQPEQAPNNYTKLTGTLTSDCTLVLLRDAGSPFYFVVENATTGAYTVTVKINSAYNGVVIDQGDVAWVVTYDGLNLVDVTPAAGMGTGDVVGPPTATDSAVALYDGTTGELLKDSAKTLPTGDIVGTTATQTLTNKTLTAPVITDFSNMAHDHLDADDGGQLDGGAIGTGTVAAARLGLMTGDAGAGGAKGATPAPGAGDAAANKFLKADATWAVPAGGSPGGSSGDVQYNNAGAFAGSHLSQSGSQLIVASTKTIKTAAGSAAAPSIQLGQDDMGFYKQASDIIGLSHFGTNYQIIAYNYYDLQRDDGYFALNTDVKFKRNADGDAEILPKSGRGMIVLTARCMGRTNSTAAPTTTQLPNDKDWCIHRDTSGGKTYLAYNHEGAIHKVELA